MIGGFTLRSIYFCYLLSIILLFGVFINSPLNLSHPGFLEIHETD